MPIQPGHSAFADPPAVTQAVQRDELGRFAAADSAIPGGSSAFTETINSTPEFYEESVSEGPPFGGEAVIERMHAGEATSEQSVEAVMGAVDAEPEEGWDPAESHPPPLKPWHDDAPNA